jgi:hypothetical protein
VGRRYYFLKIEKVKKTNFITAENKIKMKKLIILITITLLSTITYCQDMKVKWNDADGREFSITCISGDFTYSMIPGDKIEYEPSYSSNAGKVRKVGTTVIEYEPSYSDNAGKIRKVGSVQIIYEPSYSENAGKVRKVGGLTITYEPSYSSNAGKIRSTSGKVN